MDYRSILSKQKFGNRLKSLKIINEKNLKYFFDIKDIEAISVSFPNLEILEFTNCKLDDKIAYILISSLTKLSNF